MLLFWFVFPLLDHVCSLHSTKQASGELKGSTWHGMKSIFEAICSIFECHEYLNATVCKVFIGIKGLANLCNGTDCGLSTILRHGGPLLLMLHAFKALYTNKSKLHLEENGPSKLLCTLITCFKIRTKKLSASVVSIKLSTLQGVWVWGWRENYWNRERREI